MMLLLTTLALKGLLIQLLYIIVAILIIACIIWCVQKYIGPIPPPILTIIAVIVLIIAVLMFLPGCALTYSTDGKTQTFGVSAAPTSSDYKEINQILK